LRDRARILHFSSDTILVVKALILRLTDYNPGFNSREREVDSFQHNAVNRGTFKIPAQWWVTLRRERSDSRTHSKQNQFAFRLAGRVPSTTARWTYIVAVEIRGQYLAKSAQRKMTGIDPFLAPYLSLRPALGDKIRQMSRSANEYLQSRTSILEPK
jgi:hypothetical protein